jgi:hypothetical protein
MWLPEVPLVETPFANTFLENPSVVGRSYKALLAPILMPVMAS